MPFFWYFTLMIERIFVSGSEAALPALDNRNPDAMVQARLKALLWRATNLAMESAFSYGKDLPVGATVASGDWIVGRYFASDNRNGYRQMHAEYMASMDARMNQLRSGTGAPDTVVVTLEPCDNCQDFLATIPSLKRVGFGLPRKAASDRGLIKPHDETIFQRALRVGLPYEVVQIDDTDLIEAGSIILHYTQRNRETESVEVDHLGLQKALTELKGR